MVRPAKLADESLNAKVLVLACGGRKLCFVALDVTIVVRRYTMQIRKAASEEFGFDPEAVMVHATQTHSAPPLGGFMMDEDFQLEPEYAWLGGGTEHYDAFVVEKVVEAIRQAHSALRPVEMGVGSGIEGRVAFNRRAVLRDGSVRLTKRQWVDALGPVDIRYLEGPMDPELGVVCFRTDGLSVPAIVVSYTCHPVHVFPSLAVSADWPGALSQELRRARGEGCVPLVLNGACGDINPWPPYDPDYVVDHKRMGRMLAETAEKVLETLAFKEAEDLDWAVKHLKIPFREVDSDEFDAARRLLEAHPEPMWADAQRTVVKREWMLAAGLYGLCLQKQREQELDYEIQAFRVGETAFVGLPGEPFVEGQLRIKLASPATSTYVVHCTTQYVGYLPTREAILRGGHEARTSWWSKLAPEALDRVVDGALGTLKALF